MFYFCLTNVNSIYLKSIYLDHMSSQAYSLLQYINVSYNIVVKVIVGYSSYNISYISKQSYLHLF